jgi:dihydroorotase
LREGATAELVLFDPEAPWKPRERKLETKSKNSPFMDRELKGKILMTLARGRVVFDALGSDR